MHGDQLPRLSLVVILGTAHAVVFITVFSECPVVVKHGDERRMKPAVPIIGRLKQQANHCDSGGGNSPTASRPRVLAESDYQTSGTHQISIFTSCPRITASGQASITGISRYELAVAVAESESRCDPRPTAIRLARKGRLFRTSWVMASVSTE